MNKPMYEMEGAVEAASSRSKWLSVSRNTAGARFIVDSAGQPVQLFGMARCAYHSEDDEDPVYGGIEGLVSHFRSLGMNLIRLSIHESKNEQPADLIEACGGYNPEGIRRYIQRYVEPDVQAIIQQGMYVILDLHMYPPTTPHPSGLLDYAREHYFPIWRELAAYFKDEPMIAMYELWNEPYAADQGALCISEQGLIIGGEGDGYDWNSGVREFFVELVQLVRSIDDRHILMLSDFNAGWGAAWRTTWKGHVERIGGLDGNLVFSQHAACEQLGSQAFPRMSKYWEALADEENIALVFGEVETEEELMHGEAMDHFIAWLAATAPTHHFAAILWRPHDDERNYVAHWQDFAACYTQPNKP